MTRLFAAVAALAMLSACAAQNIANEPIKDLGDFALGHNIVVAPDTVKGPLSREVSSDDWVESLKPAVQTRLGRYEGDRLVHLGINVSGYILAQPGIPLVMNPKSALIVTVTAWDDQAGAKFHDEPNQIMVVERFEDGAFIGSGYTNSAEEQMEKLSFQMADAIEQWLSRNADCMRNNPTEPVADPCWVNDPEPDVTELSADR